MKLYKVVSMWRARALRLPMKWFSSASQALRAVWPRCRVTSCRSSEIVPQIHDFTTLIDACSVQEHVIGE
jgi:hypothetical protein